MISAKNCKKDLKKAKIKRRQSAKPRRKGICWAMENFFPDLLEGKDGTIYSGYQQDVKEKHYLRKETRDKTVMSIVMNKIFSNRRHLLVKKIVY